MCTAHLVTSGTPGTSAPASTLVEVEVAVAVAVAVVEVVKFLLVVVEVLFRHFERNSWLL